MLRKMKTASATLGAADPCRSRSIAIVAAGLVFTYRFLPSRHSGCLSPLLSHLVLVYLCFRSLAIKFCSFDKHASQSLPSTVSWRSWHKVTGTTYAAVATRHATQDEDSECYTRGCGPVSFSIDCYCGCWIGLHLSFPPISVADHQDGSTGLRVTLKFQQGIVSFLEPLGLPVSTSITPCLGVSLLSVVGDKILFVRQARKSILALHRLLAVVAWKRTDDGVPQDSHAFSTEDTSVPVRQQKCQRRRLLGHRCGVRGLMLVRHQDHSSIENIGQPDRCTAWTCLKKHMRSLSQYPRGPEFTAALSSRKIKTLHAVALGEDGAFFLSYTTADGLQHLNEWQDPKSRYEALYSWLFEENVAHDRTSVCVSLGMRGSFFAASSQGHRWRNIPEDLQDYYQKFTRLDLFIASRVNTVDLGVKDTFLGIRVDGALFWELQNQYPELHKMIGERGFNNVHVAFFKDKTVNWSLPPLWIEDIQALFKQYATKAGAYSPQAQLSALVLQKRLQLQASSSSNPSGRWQPSQEHHSTTETRFDWNQAMGTTQSLLDAWNTAQGQAQYGNAVNSGINTFNAANGGLQLVNSVASSGLMTGQLVGQFAGAAASCCMM
nr:hypothetical protein CFP56_37052 [Quercus suber]